MIIKFGKKYRLHIAGFKFYVRYFWIGIYWENDKINHWCNIWICIIPMLPFQIAWIYGKQPGYSHVYARPIKESQ